MAVRDEMMHRQQALAAFGDFVLDHDDLEAILTEGCRLVASALAADLAKVVEIERETQTGLVRAGIGWRPGIVGQERVSLTGRSSEAYAIEKTEPVITNDVDKETRFDFPRFLRDHGVVALVNVPILLPGRVPWGVLQVDARTIRTFDRDDIEFLKIYAMVLGPVIDRLRVAEEREAARRGMAEREDQLRSDITRRRRDAAAARESEERLGLAIEIGELASWDWDLRSGQVTWNDRHFLMQGYAVDEVTPSYEAWVARVHPDDVAETVARIEHARDARATYAHDFRTWHPDGKVHWCSARGRFFYDDQGLPYRMVGVMEDVTDRVQAQSALRESEERYRAILDSALDYAIFTTDPAGRILTWSPGATAVFGWTAEQAIGKDMAMTFVPEDRADDIPARERAEAREKGVAPNVRWHLRNDGQRVFIEGTTRRMRDDAANLLGFLKVGQDVTPRRAWEERQQVLVAELQHRTRNLLGVVRSMADKTARTSADFADFRGRFRDRLDALARVQGLLSRLNDHDRVRFDELVGAEIAAMDGDAERVSLQGPSGIRLRSSTVQTLAMALHELATNAVKYGALGQPRGRLAIRWWFEPSGANAKPWLHIDWRESGVTMPPSGTQAQGSGQGRELIEQALPYQLQARTRYALCPDGVHCTISVPVSEKTGGVDTE